MKLTIVCTTAVLASLVQGQFQAICQPLGVYQISNQISIRQGLNRWFAVAQGRIGPTCTNDWEARENCVINVLDPPQWCQMYADYQVTDNTQNICASFAALQAQALAVCGVINPNGGGQGFAGCACEVRHVVGPVDSPVAVFSMYAEGSRIIRPPVDDAQHELHIELEIK